MNNILNDIFNLQSGEKKWWHQFSYTEIHKFDVPSLINLAKNALFFQSLYQGGQVFEQTIRFDGSDTAVVLEALKDLQIRVVYQTMSPVEGVTSMFGIMDTGAVFGDFYHDNGYDRLTVVSSDNHVLQEICNRFIGE